MIKPIAIHTINRIHVSCGRPYIMNPQIKIPNAGTIGTSGVRKGRGLFGRVYRSTITPRHTITNASSVPIETSWPSRSIGKTPATRAATTPVTMVVT